MKLIKNIFLISFLLTSSFALASNDDYDVNYYENQESVLFKIRGFYVNAPAKINKAPVVNNADKPGELMKNGYGFDTATTYFFTDNIAAELSLGFGMLKTKKSVLNKAAVAYGDGSGSAGKNNNVFFIPLAATVQYHIAPFGAIRPYLGGGYHGSYLYTRSKAIKFKWGHGPVLQAGVDFVAKDDTFITFDIKKYFLKSKVTFKKGFLFPDDSSKSGVSSKINLNPLIISLGVGFKF